MNPKIISMYRIKNEEKWIQKSIESIYDFCSEIIIFDDSSTDRTVEICSSFDKVTKIISQEHDSFDEMRDRNLLLHHALSRNPDFLLTIDGDEIFMPNAAEILFDDLLIYPDADVYEIELITLWDGLDQYRYDGIFGNFWNKRLHNMKNQPKDMNYYESPYPGNLHCSGLNNFKEDNVVRSNVKMFHLASLTKEIRQKKFEFYTTFDSNNLETDGYKHLISGEGRFSGPCGIELRKLPRDVCISI